jgi:hypothetical protein
MQNVNCNFSELDSYISDPKIYLFAFSPHPSSLPHRERRGVRRRLSNRKCKNSEKIHLSSLITQILLL